MRTDMSGNPSFKELVKREREVALGAYTHQELPFEKLVEELNPERDLSRSPLFQVMMVLEHARREALELPGVKLDGLGEGGEAGSEGQGAKFDLTLSIADFGQELTAVAEYSRDLFDAGTIEWLMKHYGNALKGIAENGARPICDLSLLSETEREQIVVEWNQTGTSYSRDRRIHELFEEQAERSPERIALISEEQALSYGELNRRTNQLGNYLRKLRVGPEVVVGLCLRRSMEMVVGLLGALKAGGAYLPLDPELPLERTGHMLEDAGVAVALTERRLEDRLPTFW